MKRILLTIAFAAAAAGFQAPVEAAFISGNQAFISTATTSAPGNNVDNTTFTFDFSTLSGGVNQTGDFLGESASFINILDTTTAAAFVFGNAAFGTFTVTTVNVNTLNSGVARTLNFTGTYTPGTDFGGAFDPTVATLSITINQASPGVLSASATLATGADVPEPSTIVLLGTFCIPAAVGLLRRRRLTASS